MPMTVERVTLPTGYWVDGEHFRDAALRLMTGADEEFMALLFHAVAPVVWTNALLSRCVTHLQPGETVSPSKVAALTVGDREALLLHLRRLTFGDRMQCTLTCPQPDCGELMDFELNVTDLLQPPVSDPKPFHEIDVEIDGRLHRIRFRLPTGHDQEAASRQARVDVRQAVAGLLKRCVEGVVDGNDPTLAWSPDQLAELPVRMADLDPQAELVLNLTCPACGEDFRSIFDTCSYLMQEIGMDLDGLYREVHLLARFYHWSEREILGMSTSKRRRYLNLVLDSVPSTEWDR